MLFDFDGTLADSFAAITLSTNHVRGRYGLPPLDEQEHAASCLRSEVAVRPSH